MYYCNLDNELRLKKTTISYIKSKERIVIYTSFFQRKVMDNRQEGAHKFVFQDNVEICIHRRRSTGDMVRYEKYYKPVIEKYYHLS